MTALARELAKTRRVCAVGNAPMGAQSLGPRIPEDQESSGSFEWHEWILPPGYAGRFSKVFAPLLARRVGRLTKALRRSTGEWPCVVAPYPYNEPWLALVPECPVIYYNLDDYSLYEPHKASRVAELESRLVHRSERILCLALTQVERFRRQVTDQKRVHHFPLGVMDRFIRPFGNDDVEVRSVVYIGNMEDRVDWRFVAEVASRCPQLKFYFVGDVTPEATPPAEWQQERTTALAMPNVIAVGRVSQADITAWSWKAGVNWMPYKASHPFNIACCPTKIMDYMASGRPILSTSVPECALYPEWIAICDDAVTAAEWLHEQVGADSDSIKINGRIEFAMKNTWIIRAQELNNLL
ncbi:MAG: glycosyltransferase [Armatimonadetes bacterium]|nr:glycosyltransferase [Akkermansiaceae bacterium]